MKLKQFLISGNKHKRYVLLLLVMLCNQLAFAFYPETNDGKLVYYVDSYNKQAYVKCLKDNSLTSVSIPANITYNGTTYPVTQISKSAFVNETGLRSVWYNSTNLKIIERDAFLGCTSLIAVTPSGIASKSNTLYISSNMNVIKEEAFNGCTQLTHLTLDNSKEMLLARDVFFGSNIQYADIYGTVPSGLFRNSKKLVGVNLLKPTSSDSNTICRVLDYAFENCSNLKQIYIGDHIGAIYEGAFAGTGITSVSIPETVYFNSDKQFKGCKNLIGVTLSCPNVPDYIFSDCNSIEGVTINNTVRKIGNYAFYGCSLIKEVVLPEGLTSVGDNAFNFTANLTKVVIPNSLTSFGASIFSKNATVETLVINKSTTDGTFSQNLNLKKVNKVEFGSDVIYIGKQICKDMTTLKEFTIARNDVVISEEAFMGCTGLPTLNFNGAQIGKKAFYGCTGIKTANIKCNYLQEMAFACCTGLTTLDLTVSKSIGQSAFSGCDGLSSTTLNALPGISKPCFQNCTGDVIINCNSSNSTSSINANNCLFYGSAFTSASTKYFEKNLFTGCMSLQTVTLDTPTSAWTTCMLDGCPNVSQVLLNNAPTSIKVDESGYVYSESGSRKNIQFIPPTLTRLTLMPKNHYFAPGSISKFRGVIDATQLTSFPTIGDGSSEATVICKPEMETQFKKYFKNVITQSEGLKGDMNNDGKVTISDVNILVDEILNK